MKKQVIESFLAIVFIVMFVPNLGLAKGKAELNATTFVDPTSSYSSNTTQDELQFIYSLYDEGLVDAKYIYQLDKLVNKYESDLEFQFLLGYDAIDFELYTKSQNMTNKY